MPRVTIAVASWALLEGEVALGAFGYSEHRRRWRFIGTAGGPFTRFEDLDLSKVDGVIGFFFGSTVTQQVAASVREAAVAAVNVSNAYELIPLPRVGPDDQAIGRLGAEHLLERGFIHYGYIHQGDTWFSQRRGDAFRALIEQDARRSCHDLTAPLSKAVSSPELIRHWLTGLPKPIGIMAATDFLAHQVIDQADDLGMRVPDDVAVLGVDNNKWEIALSTTPLSSIEHDLWQIGYRAAELLDQLMEGQPPPEHPMWVPPVGVVSRQSTDIVLTEDPLVGRALAYIHEHCASGITVEDVLDQLGVSRRNLEVQMKRTTGQSPKNAISRARIERAKAMLTGGDDTMDRIARAVGYDSANRFFIVFKRITGMTPGQYRQRFGLKHIVSRDGLG